MATLTTRLGLRKPADDGSEAVNVATDLNANWDVVDENIGFTRCLSTDHPADPYDGMPIKEDDTGLVRVWNADDETWDIVTIPPSVGTSTDRPASPSTGDDLFETDTEARSVYTGTAWQYIGAPLVLDSIDDITTTKFPGLEVYETSTGHKLIWDGTTWQYVHFEPTDWTTLTLTSPYQAHNTTTGGFGYTPAYRFISPTTVEIRGVVSRSSGDIATSDVIADLPTAIQPAQQANGLGAAGTTGGTNSGWSVRVDVRSGSATSHANTICPVFTGGFGTAAPTWIALDGIVYDLI